MSRPPENPPIPFKRPVSKATRTKINAPAYAELQTLSNFSFLRGASHPGELVIQAKELGHTAIGVADINSVAGVVRAHSQAKAEGFKLLVGARIILDDGLSCILYPTDRTAWGRLCKLLSDGKRSAEKGECHITLYDLERHVKGQVVIVLPPDDFETREAELSLMVERLKAATPQGIWIALHWLFRGDDRSRMRQINAFANTNAVPLVATNAVLYHQPERRKLQDAISCIREGCTIGQAGFRLEANAERHLKAPQEMARLFRDYPQAIEATQDIVALCNFRLDELQYNYPHEPVPPGKTADGHLRDLVEKGLEAHFSDKTPERIRALVEKELSLIQELQYAHYFLTVHDIVAWARGEGILCQGRGSAANSAICYYLKVTAVDPNQSSVLFDRFLSRERKEPPDIDVDFEHERREEVMQYIYRRYGRHRAAIAATVITYRPRSAVREIGKVMGLSEDITSALASTVWGSWGKEIPEEHVKETGLDIDDPLLKQTIDLTQELLGFPRHLSQHVGGYVLTDDPLEELVPIGNAAMQDRTFIEWDKDDIDELKILKVDVLALGMLTCIAKSFALIKQHYGLSYDLHSVEQEDPKVYEMLQRADAIGVFQVESRAQMNMLPRLKPNTFYDLVIEVAIVRPGPIQGDMVHPYLRRRDGKEEVTYPWPKKHPEKRDELKNILDRTLGVPLFQEQAMQIAIDAAKFSAEEANKLRRAMATFRNVGTIHLLQTRMVNAMIKRGYEPEFAANCFEQIKGFGSYGFPESHAASFARLVYISAWIKCYFPDVFCASLLNSQPMGFYAPAQIVRDAREHSIEVRPPDINQSDWDNTLEECMDDGQFCVRLGFRQVNGLCEETMKGFIRKRKAQFSTPDEAQKLTGISVEILERLASADAMRSMGLDRREALWAIRGMATDKAQLPLFGASNALATGNEAPVSLPEMPLNEHVVADYQTQRLSLKAHPMKLLRPIYNKGIASRILQNAKRKPLPVLTAQGLLNTRQNQSVTVAGVVLVRQKPGTAKGVVFITLEDETGSMNVVVWRKLMEKYRRTIMAGRLIAVKGHIEREKEIIHVIAHELIDCTHDLDNLSDDDFELQFANADHVKSPLPDESSMKRKVKRMAARGETAEADMQQDDQGRWALRNPGATMPFQRPKNADMVPLSHADEVVKPQVERGNWPIDQEDAKSLCPPRIKKLPPVNQGRHPRNVRIIPKSRDFH